MVGKLLLCDWNFELGVSFTLYKLLYWEIGPYIAVLLYYYYYNLIYLGKLEQNSSIDSIQGNTWSECWRHMLHKFLVFLAFVQISFGFYSNFARFIFICVFCYSSNLRKIREKPLKNLYSHVQFFRFFKLSYKSLIIWQPWILLQFSLNLLLFKLVLCKIDLMSFKSYFYLNQKLDWFN